MKTKTFENNKKSLHGILAAIFTTALAFVLFIGAFVLVGCSDATQNTEHGVNDEQNMIASYSAVLASNDGIATIDNVADFQ